MPIDEDANAPVRVQIIQEEKAPVEKRTVPVTVVVSQVPIPVAPLSNKRIQCILSVTAANVFLCTSQAQAQQVTPTYNAGAQLIAGVYTLVGTGEFWLVASAGNIPVGIISEYEI